MSRLQKKCLIGSASLHALLFLVLFLGAVFRPEEEVVYASEVMTLVSDQAFASAPSAQPAEATPPVQQPQREPTPEPEPVRQPEPEPEPEPEPVRQPEPEPVRRPDPEPVQPRRVEPAPQPVVRETPTPTPAPRTEPERPAWTPTAPKINLDQLQVRRDTSTAPSQAQAARAAAEAARREKERQQRLESAINNSVSSINSRSSDLQISAPTAGTLGVSYAGFEAALQRVYLRAWSPASGIADDDETADVKVRVARDGRILSAVISKGSGNSRLDASVRTAIDRVKSVGQPFPQNAREDSREYILKFNLKAKNLAG